MTGLRYFDMSDCRRSYLLPDTVDCNIPRRPSPGEPGAYGFARGLLVEASRFLGGQPTALHYQERHNPETRRFVDTRVTATVATGDRRVAVVLTYGSAPNAWRDFWHLTVDGRVPDDAVGRYPPSAPVLGFLVYRAVRDGPAGLPAAAGPGRLPRPRTASPGGGQVCPGCGQPVRPGHPGPTGKGQES